MACHGKNGKKRNNPLSSDQLPTAILNTLQAKDFTHLKDRVEGLSWNQLEQHIALYNGYVDKLNKIQTALSEASHNKSYDTLRDLQLSQSYALNGTVLHDLYFSNLGGLSSIPSERTQRCLERDFGSVENYLGDLAAVGKKMRGWVLTGLNLLNGRIYNYGMDAHDVGTPYGVYPLVVLDVYEHAYMIDFGTNRRPYLDIFTRNINWPVVDQRLNQGIVLLDSGKHLEG